MTNRIEGPKAEAAAPLPEGFITKEEVARRLRKSPRTIENWQRRGFVPVIKAGRSSLYKWSDVETHLQQHFRVCRLRPPTPPPTTDENGKA